jgi:DNA-binding IclR family transcriptional regulator
VAHRSAGQSVLARVVTVLETFDQDNASLSVSHIARRSGLPVPTVHRIVGELVEMGLLERGDDREVRVGVRLWEIAAAAPRALGLREAAMPFMEDLHAATRQHIHLYVLEGRDALVIERLSARNAVVNFARVGGRLPLHASAGGLVLLANASAELQESFLAMTLRAYTPFTPTDPAQIRQILAGIRSRGHVVCEGYIAAEALAVGVPVRSPEGAVVAALGVVVPCENTQPMVHVHALNVAANGISRALAHPRMRVRPPRFFPPAEIIN